MDDLEADEGSTAESSGLGGAHLARRRFVVALGFGIANAALLKRLPDRRRAPDVLATGVGSCAMITAITEADDPEAVVAELLALH